MEINDIVDETGMYAMFAMKEMDLDEEQASSAMKIFCFSLRENLGGQQIYISAKSIKQEKISGEIRMAHREFIKTQCKKYEISFREYSRIIKGREKKQ